MSRNIAPLQIQDSRWHRWFWQYNKYVALLKVLTTEYSKPAEFTELMAMQILTAAQPQHEGYRYIRALLDSFTIHRNHGMHTVLVNELMRESLHTLRRRLVDERIPLYFLKPLMRLILKGLDCPHSCAKLIHTGESNDKRTVEHI